MESMRYQRSSLCGESRGRVVQELRGQINTTANTQGSLLHRSTNRNLEYRQNPLWRHQVSFPFTQANLTTSPFLFDLPLALELLEDE